MIEVGDYVEFGRWFQHKNGRVLPVEWRALSIFDGVALLVSRFGLEAKRFDGNSNEWENSEIRSWLNGYFKMAFNAEELTALDGEIFLPSYQEVKDLIPITGCVRKCSPTPWAKARGALVDRGKCLWWTRTVSERFRRFAYVVSADGGFRQEDFRLERACVRPCVRVKIEALRVDDEI